MKNNKRLIHKTGLTLIKKKAFFIKVICGVLPTRYEYET